MIQVEISNEDGKALFGFLARSAGSTFAEELMPVVNLMEGISRALREVGDPISSRTPGE